MTGIPFVIVFIIAIIAMILMISKLKIHPFLSIMTVSLVLGIIGGIPLVNTTTADGASVNGIATVIGNGFSSTFTSIGIVIIFGAMIGAFLEATGAALKLADIVVKLIGPKHPELAIELMGWVVSIPVFCDSGFVVLNPIRKALVKKTGASSIAMTLCLSAGLYASHVFIPPTPGPIAAANTLGIGNNLLLIMGLGLLVSIPALAGAYFYAKPKYTSDADYEAKKDAQDFLTILLTHSFSMPIYIDFEEGDKRKKAHNTAYIYTFCKELEKYRTFIGIYGSDISTFHDMVYINQLYDFTWWVARYGTDPKYALKNLHMHQFSSKGYVPGIVGNVDMNYCYREFPTIIFKGGYNDFTV